MTDDDTPEILGETSYPSKVVKVSSPNKKRVSPPQSRSRLRSSSPTGLRNGRKFILHAVPSFPPLTPYHTSKEGTSEIGNDDGATNKNNWYEARFGRFSELIMDNLLTAYSIVQNNWTKLLIGFQLPQIHPKTSSVLPEFGKPCSKRQCYFLMPLQSSVISLYQKASSHYLCANLQLLCCCNLLSLL